MDTSLLAVLGIGYGELVVLVTALLLTMVIAAGLIGFIVWVVRRGSPAAARVTCPKCGTPLAPNAAEGLCAACLLKTVIETPAGAKGKAEYPGREQLARVFPQLEILEPLGRGGMGMVWKARQPQLDRLVALKILSPELSGDAAFAERFGREAKALARLNHPNIVGIYDFGQVSGFYYFLMELLDGPSLWEVERQRKPLRAEEVRQIAGAVCEGLQYAHDAGVVHRDIKPANILFDKKGRVKIGDFGVAKLLGVEVTGLGLTDGRGVLGTPYYMAPEQWETPLTVDRRADIYALGAVVYEMLTGELPLGRFPAPSRKAGIDSRWDEVVFRALEKDPALRYDQASQFRSALEAR